MNDLLLRSNWTAAGIVLVWGTYGLATVFFFVLARHARKYRYKKIKAWGTIFFLVGIIMILIFIGVVYPWGIDEGAKVYFHPLESTSQPQQPQQSIFP